MIVGATILDLAKRFMFQFHYQKMKPNLNLELLYSDTDSLIYAIKTDDVYRDLEKIKADFDFSNYDKDHFLFEDTNKKVVLKFKDETGGKPIREFIALKPKLYSVVLNGKQNLSHPSTPHSYLLQKKIPPPTLPTPLNLLH